MILQPARFTKHENHFSSGGLLPHLFTLTCTPFEAIGGLSFCSTFCDALKRPSPFKECGTLCCPDFPPPLPEAVDAEKMGQSQVTFNTIGLPFRSISISVVIPGSKMPKISM